MENFLQVSNITKSLKLEGRQLPILSGISFSMQKGEFVALIGASGSGKSTLLGILATIDDADEGTIVFGGEQIQSLPETKAARFRNHNIGIVFQSYRLLNSLSAWENVAAPMYVSRNKRSIKQRAQHLLDLVGLNGKYNNLPSQLSGGQQQRVAIARALANEPLLLLADEPTGNLDSISGKQIIDLFKKLQQELGLTLLVATHDAGIAATADRVIYLADGYIADYA